MTAAARVRLARMLSDELRLLESVVLAERAAVDIDRGFGVAAHAAVAACPAGPRRAVEAEMWARRAGDRVVTLIRPNMSADDLDALVELHTALARRAA